MTNYVIDVHVGVPMSNHVIGMHVLVSIHNHVMEIRIGVLTDNPPYQTGTSQLANNASAVLQRGMKRTVP